jgi:hypothetical protein
VTAWKYIGASDPTRLAALLSAVSFSHIAERLEREMNIVCCHKQDCNDSPGFARIIYCAEIGQMLFDLFFNSAFGYRGAYFESPEKGLAANRQLLRTQKLLAWSTENCSEQDVTFTRRSLSASSAKAWLAESTLELCAACSGEWSTSHQSDLEIVNGRWGIRQSHSRSMGPAGSSVPEAQSIGGFVNNSSDEYVAPHKVGRASDIWQRGWS